MSRAPTRAGSRGRAWRLDFAPEVLRANPAHVGSWLVHAPHSHPHWPWKIVACVSLAQVSGVEPAKLTRPGMTHEFLVLSLDPDRLPNPLEHIETFERGTKVSFLTPFEVAHQVALRHDVDARRILDSLARAFVDGLLVPDQDHRASINGCLDTTAACYRAGKHGDLS